MITTEKLVRSLIWLKSVLHQSMEIAQPIHFFLWAFPQFNKNVTKRSELHEKLKKKPPAFSNALNFFRTFD